MLQQRDEGCSIYIFRPLYAFKKLFKITEAATVSFCLIVTLFLMDVAFINFLASDVLYDSSHIQKVKGSPIGGNPKETNEGNKHDRGLERF